MKINLENIKNIELCYENCETDTIYFGSLLGIDLGKKTKQTKFPYAQIGKIAYGIKTFEIALKDNFYSLRTDLAQFFIHYLDGTVEHYFVQWGKNDCEWASSSLQKVHKNGDYESLTSNCESVFLVEPTA